MHAFSSVIGLVHELWWIKCCEVELMSLRQSLQWGWIRILRSTMFLNWCVGGDPGAGKESQTGDDEGWMAVCCVLVFTENVKNPSDEHLRPVVSKDD